MAPSFEAARIKLARANQHIKDLKAQIGKFFSREGAHVAFELADEFTKGTGRETAAFVYRQKEPVPSDWPAIIGDGIHNMRASLDLLVSDLHRLTGGRPEDTSHVHYPFCKDKNSLTDMIRSRRLSRIGRDFIDLIEETAPYKGGNDGLRAIHDLDLLDKHQTLVATISVVQLVWPISVTDGPQDFMTGVVKDGQRLMIFPRAFAYALPLGTRIKANFLIVFGDVGFFTGRDVVTQLEACTASIAVIIDRFTDVVNKKSSKTLTGTEDR